MPRPKKVIRFKLSPFTNRAGTISWRATGTKNDGSRVRQNFLDKAEALQTVADLELEAAGQSESRRALRTSLSSEELSEAEAALQQIGDLKLSKVVSHYLGLQARAKGKGVNLDEALGFLEARYRPETKEISILNAKDEFLAKRVAISTATRRNYESSLKLLLKPDPNKLVHAFTVADIEKAISGYKNLSSRKTRRRVFSVFFNWAIRHHYCLEDPCKRLDKLPKDMTQIAVLSLDEVRRLLYAAICYQDGAATASVAISLFAGLRPSEIVDLKPEDIGTEKIRVSGGKLRRKLKRSVPIPPNLATWLENYPFKGLPKGWSYKMKKLKAATKATSWVQDILRHTAITYQAERDENLPLTAFNCGTSVQMMDLHYRNTIDNKKTITAFWDLTPAELMAKKPEIVLPGRPRIAWPDKKVLAKLVWQKPLIHAAGDIGVSDVALRKHCVKLGIDLPAPGHWLRQRRDEKM